MDSEAFLLKVEKKETISIDVQSTNGIEIVTEIIVEEQGVFYKATVRKIEGFSLEVLGVIKEVTPVKVTTTEYQEVLTLKGTKQELIDKLHEALTHEVGYLYSDISEPYRGSIEEYARVSDEETKYIAQAVISDLFYEGENE